MVAELHHVNAAPAPGESFDAALAPVALVTLHYTVGAPNFRALQNGNLRCLVKGF
jgi:hypothetical protein